MIVFKRYGKEVKLTNAEWKNIRTRINLKNAKITSHLAEPEYNINIECKICWRYDNCHDCPFGVFIAKFEDDSPCTHFLYSLFKSSKFKFTEDVVWWEEVDDKKARQQLKRLNKFMDKIEEENK